MFRYILALMLIVNMAFGFQIRTGEREEEFRIVFQIKDNTEFDIIQIEKTVIVKIEETFEGNRIKPIPAVEIELYQSENKPTSIVYIQNTLNSQIKVFTLNNPKRIVIDIKKQDTADNPLKQFSQASKPKEDNKKTTNLESVDLEKILSAIQQEDSLETDVGYYKNYRGKKKIIVIDPGHGGQDPGATSNGLREKDINLKVAKLLKSYLDKDPRFVAYLTREDDRYIPLYERTLIALEKNADLFISIHTNASENPNLNGTYVYTLNLRGATSKLAKMVEERENKTVLNVVKVSANPNVNRIVADMAISHTMTEGLNFAKFVEANFKSSIREIEFKRIESANFAVLKTPSIPSILFETAFITNEKDARLLRDDAFLDRLAKVLYKSTSDYFFKYKNLVFIQGKVN